MAFSASSPCTLSWLPLLPCSTNILHVISVRSTLLWKPPPHLDVEQSLRPRVRAVWARVLTLDSPDWERVDAERPTWARIASSLLAMTKKGKTMCHCISVTKIDIDSLLPNHPTEVNFSMFQGNLKDRNVPGVGHLTITQEGGRAGEGGGGGGGGVWMCEFRIDRCECASFELIGTRSSVTGVYLLKNIRLFSERNLR